MMMAHFFLLLLLFLLARHCQSRCACSRFGFRTHEVGRYILLKCVDGMCLGELFSSVSTLCCANFRSLMLGNLCVLSVFFHPHKVSQRNCERGPNATSDDENDGETPRPYLIELFLLDLCCCASLFVHFPC